MRLDGQRVVVIGGISGIGLAVARQAQEAGARVLVAGRSPERVAQALSQLGGAAMGESVDARDEAALGRFFGRFGGGSGGAETDAAAIDHLVVTVGPGAPKQRYASFVEQPLADAHALFDNKFWAQYLCARLAAPYVARGGSITLFGGGAARKPVRAMAVLAAVQAAIEGLMRGMALDLAPVRVNAVAPGRIASSSFAAIPGPEREAMFKAWAESLPVQRIGTPDDAAAAALYLMGNRYTTGHVLYVDGGHALAG
jgi:NAD(P)-dependent dehydrogenase (short-subunit alcohol dehydrogenase family)